MAGKIRPTIDVETTVADIVGIGNIAGTQVNPATEDSLALVKTAVEAAPYKGTTVTKYALTITSADTEYSQALPANTKQFSVHLRDMAAFRLAYVTGKVATPTNPFETVPAGSEKYVENIQPSALTLYIASPVATKTAEIEAWA